MIKEIKRKTKTIIALFLCISILVSVPVFTVMAATDALTEEELEILQVLDIVGEEHNVEFFSGEQEITRAEFAVYAAGFLGIKVSEGDTLYYHDVPKMHYAYGAITALTEAGYFSGTGEKLFEPDNFMSQEHAYIFMLKLIGCGPYLENSFNSKTVNGLAQASGISAKIAIRENLTLVGLFRLLYNTLFAEVYDVSTIGNGNVTVSLSGENMLYRTRKLVYVKNALMSATAGVNIYGESKDDRVTIIGGKTFKKSVVDTEKHLGHYVDYIYKDARDDENDEILWIKNRFDDDKLVIEKGKKDTYNKVTRTLTYYVDGQEKAKEITFPQNMFVIYNGAYIGSGTDNILAKDRYTITVLDINGTKNGLVIIEEYENMYVSAVSTTEHSVYDERTNKSLSLKPEDYDSIKICDASGGIIDFSSISTGNILSVFLSADKKTIKVVCSSEVVSGSIETIKTKAGEKAIKVLDEEYELSDSQINTSNLSAGSNVELFLDFKGLVEEIKTGGATNYSVGYLIQAAIDTLFDSTMRIKLLDETGSIQIYNVAGKVIIDNQRQATAEQAYATLSIGSSINGIKPQLVLYRLNKNNEISKICTASEEGQPFNGLLQTETIPDENTYTPYPEINIKKFYEDYFSKYNSNTMIIGNRVLADNDTKVFFVPSDNQIMSSEDEFFNVGVLQHNQDYRNSTTYSLSENNNGPVDFVVTKQGMSVGQITARNTPIVFDSFIDVWDAEREEVAKVIQYVTSAGAFEQIKISNRASDNIDIESYNLKRGDIFRYVTNKQGEIAKIEIAYRADGSMIGYANTEVMSYSARFVSGYVHDVFDGIIKLGYTSGASFGELVKAPSVALIYDSEKDIFYMGSVYDAKTWKRYKDDSLCSRVAVQQSSGLSSLMVIYK